VTTTAEQAKLQAVRDYVIAEAQHEQAKQKYMETRQALLSMFEKTVGKQQENIGGFTVTVEYPERLKWDTEELAALYGADLPAHVKRSLSVDLRVLRRLPQSEQEDLAKCYEHALGTPTIDIFVR
jgi:hypothetical protein